MTKHPPYSDWLLDDRSRSPSDQAALEAHLSACPDCRGLKGAWLEARSALRAAPIVRPPAGFTARWQARLARRQSSRQARQAWGALALTLGASAAALTWLTLAALSTPAALLAEGINSAIEVAHGFRLGLDLFRGLLSVLPSPHGTLALIGVSLGLGAAFAGLSLVWVLSAVRFAYLPRSRGGLT